MVLFTGNNNRLITLEFPKPVRQNLRWPEYMYRVFTVWIGESMIWRDNQYNKRVPLLSQIKTLKRRVEIKSICYLINWWYKEKPKQSYFLSRFDEKVQLNHFKLVTKVRLTTINSAWFTSKWPKSRIQSPQSGTARRHLFYCLTWPLETTRADTHKPGPCVVALRVVIVFNRMKIFRYHVYFQNFINFKKS